MATPQRIRESGERPGGEARQAGVRGTAPLTAARPQDAYDWREDVRSAAGLNVLAGIWLIISPFVLDYSGADAMWNPIVFGAIVGVFALARISGAFRAAWLSWLNMAIGVWLFISAFWLAETTRASWNVGVLGVIVFVLAAWSAAATGSARAARNRTA